MSNASPTGGPAEPSSSVPAAPAQPASSVDTNEDVWKSEHMVAQWVAGEGARERRRAEQRRLMADLLPFEDDEVFTFVDLGAGTGAATKAVLERFSRAQAILAEYSPQMTAEGERALADFRGRFTYVELDLASADWPSEIPSAVP